MLIETNVYRRGTHGKEGSKSNCHGKHYAVSATILSEKQWYNASDSIHILNLILGASLDKDVVYVDHDQYVVSDEELPNIAAGQDRLAYLNM